MFDPATIERTHTAIPLPGEADGIRADETSDRPTPVLGIAVSVVLGFVLWAVLGFVAFRLL